MKNKFFDKPEAIPFIIFNIFITFIFILLLFSVCDSVHAASGDDLSYFPMDQNTNGHFSAGFRQAIDQSFDAGSNYIFASYYRYNNDMHYFYVIVFPKNSSSMVYGEIFNNGYQFSLYTVGDSSVFGYALCTYDEDTGLHWRAVTSLSSFYNLYSSYYSFDTDYYSNFVVKTNNTDDYDVVLRLVKPHGHELKPPQPEDPEYDSGDSAPIHVPFDNNTSGDTSFLGKNIQYYGNLINSQLNNFQNDLYENFYPLIKIFSDVYNFGLDNNGYFNLLTCFSNLFEFLFIPDPDDLTAVLISHDIYDVVGLVETTQGYVNDVKNMITDGENIYKFTIPQFTLMGVNLGPYDIDFSWYIPLKNSGDPIIAAFLIFGWVMWLHTRLPYWLRGQQGDITLLTKEVQK